MRDPVTKSSLQALMVAIGAAVQSPGSIYLVGGATAVWYNWRASTHDVDIALAPEPAGLFSVMERLKRENSVSIELASPDHFVPPLPNWQGRSPFIGRHGPVDFYHYDLYSQAFAKLERNHARDRHDVQAMVTHGMVKVDSLRTLISEVAGEAVRYPGMDLGGVIARLDALYATNRP